MKTCVEFEMQIMDAFYGEAEMTEDCRSHLATCEDCRRFYESLKAVPMDDSEFPVNDWVIQESVRAATAVFEKRNRRERLIFLCLTIAIMAGGLGLLTVGFGSALLKVYVSIYLLGPFLLPLIILKRQQRRREHA